MDPKSGPKSEPPLGVLNSCQGCHLNNKIIRSATLVLLFRVGETSCPNTSARMKRHPQICALAQVRRVISIPAAVFPL